MENKNKPVLGVTLYSFTNEWLQRRFDLGGLLAKVAQVGLGPAVEVVGFQSIRSFPDVDQEFVRYFRNLFDRYGLIPSCLGANLDVGIRKDRMMTPEETVDYITRQILTAEKLGFPVVRIQAFAKPDILDRIIPVAEKTGVHVASELHAPLSTDNPVVVELLEYYRKIQSPVLGFIPDFSSTMIAPPEIYWVSLRHAGVAEELVDALKALWKLNVPMFEKFKALAETGQKFGANPAVIGQLNTSLTMFGNMPADGLRELLPYVLHIHGKFYEVTSEGIEPSIPYPQIMSLLLEAGYTGTISAEWEGHAFTGEPIGFEQVQAWRSMCSRLLGEVWN
jgi:sugar phosphate isomerase/epimerase